MWIFKYIVCLFSGHVWVSSTYKYCIRCGKLELEHAHDITR